MTHLIVTSSLVYTPEPGPGKAPAKCVCGGNGGENTLLAAGILASLSNELGSQ